MGRVSKGPTPMIEAETKRFWIESEEQGLEEVQKRRMRGLAKRKSAFFMSDLEHCRMLEANKMGA